MWEGVLGVPTQEKGPRAARDFTEAQRLSSRRLGFSVTKACPLRCGHCSVSALPQLSNTTFRADFGMAVAQQLPALRSAGIEFIDFTGGEPTLATQFVCAVSAAARDVGISTGIVSAAHWAKTEATARRFVEVLFKDIDNWDISTDIYHLEFVPLSFVERAFGVLTDAGRTPVIRIAYHEPMTYDDALLIDRVQLFAGNRIAFQPVGPVGRATEIFQYVPVQNDSWDRAPCPTTGPLVQAGGRVSPCCAPLSHEDSEHPLLLGNAFREPLVDILHRWRVHPLLQTIRLWGFAPIFEWLEDARPTSYRHILRHRACHQCIELVRDGDLLAVAMERANTMRHRVKVAFALIEYFGEHWLDAELQEEARRLLAV